MLTSRKNIEQKQKMKKKYKMMIKMMKKEEHEQAIIMN